MGSWPSSFSFPSSSAPSLRLPPLPSPNSIINSITQYVPFPSKFEPKAIPPSDEKCHLFVVTEKAYLYRRIYAMQSLQRKQYQAMVTFVHADTISSTLYIINNVQHGHLVYICRPDGHEIHSRGEWYVTPLIMHQLEHLLTLTHTKEISDEEHTKPAISIPPQYIPLIEGALKQLRRGITPRVCCQTHNLLF